MTQDLFSIVRSTITDHPTQGTHAATTTPPASRRRTTRVWNKKQEADTKIPRQAISKNIRTADMGTQGSAIHSLFPLRLVVILSPIFWDSKLPGGGHSWTPVSFVLLYVPQRGSSCYLYALSRLVVVFQLPHCCTAERPY